MDENKNNIRLVKGGEEPERTRKRHTGAEFEQRITYQKRQKQRRIKAKRRRTFIVLLLAAVVIAIVLFLTPIFNIRSVSVEGNVHVTAEQLNEILHPLVGENLLRTGSGKITKMLKTNPYIDTVEVQKRIFPPSVDITVTEYTPAALVRAEGRTLVLNSALHVLDEQGGEQWDIPNVVGVNVKEYSNGTAKLENTDKEETLSAMLQTIESTGMLAEINEIDLNSLSYILINYDDRIEVKCGSQLDIERKIRLLKEAVTSNSLAQNARGTIDLSETGKAVYTP